ncbi:uncharacterized protein LOC125224784 [Leguminivora glycinivorella]|uniref:uncharacterized protein LOC125224784 n=1 Tax=Leguminivora glycinivorella TaxID=1035111 RepID=UPI0020101499|nr:uncharacterized protein LOC125224784 [Leguminivora glycinivorella]
MSNAEEKLRKVLNCIVQEKFPNALDVKIKPVSTNGANYCSELFEANIATPEDTHELFAKVDSLGDQLNAASKHLSNIEIFALTSLSSAYENLEAKFGIKEKFIFPKFYKSVDGVIVMENLASKGYEVYDRFKIIDLNYASKSLEALARFHALSISFKNERPEEFRKAVEVLNVTLSVFTSFHSEGQIDAAMAAVDEADREKLAKLLEGSRGLSKLLDLTEPRKTAVIVHGDYRASNLMHKQMDGEYHVIPVDYQTARLGCPVSDLLYFILLGSDQQFRKQYFRQLLDHYYEHLSLMLTKFGLQPNEVYGKEEFESDIKAKLPVALSVAALVLPFVTVDVDSAPNFESGQFTPRTSERFVKRFRELVEDMKGWGVL